MLPDPNTLSNEQLAAQCIMPRLVPRDYANDDTLRNETRRLMWLVDAFYDRGRFLVCSAAADIPKIYQGRDWEKEFPRTASRLTQMTKI